MLPLMPVVSAESDYPNVFTHAVLDCKEESVISTLYPVPECQLHKLVHISKAVWLCDFLYSHNEVHTCGFYTFCSCLRNTG